MRELTGWTRVAVAVWAAAATLFHLYGAVAGFIEPRQMRSLHLLFLLPLAFLLWPAHPERSPRHRPSAIDLALAVLAVLPNLYSYLEANRINLRFENVTPLTNAEIVLGAIISLLIVEALRRAVTPILAGLLSIGLLYLVVCEHMPGILYYRNMELKEIIETMFLLNGMGIYGSITGISATMVAIFIAFGAIVEKSGVGQFFHNLGTRVAGRQSGGPAKVEVISSALFGTISGSSTANVFATGSFTIPAMIKLGYRRHFAAGVEASSSVGGQIMPPVMGAGAFVMAEITNIPYGQICLAAVLGSLLYFLMILISVHFEAKRLRLSGVPENEIPSWGAVLHDLPLLAPVVLLMVLLFQDWSPHFAAFWAIIATFVVSWAHRQPGTLLVTLPVMAVAGVVIWQFGDEDSIWPIAIGIGAVLCLAGLTVREPTRPLVPETFGILVSAGRNMVVVALACAGAGMFVACLTVTGLVISVSNIITSLSAGNMLIAGVLLMVTTLILGMGVPTTAAYIIGASVGARILIDMGVPMLAAHMFVFYFSILADATPPVSVASYAAASIAKADPMRTGVVAARLALAGFVVGFNYLYTPALLMQGPVLDIVAEVLVNGIGLTLAAAAMSGFFRDDLANAWRIVVGAAAITLVLLLEGYDAWLRVAAEAAIVAALYAVPGFFAPSRAVVERRLAAMRNEE
ncbi:MAG: TRAP transporter fused permease subunit [Alphaproteobacteria bacterium]|nr:TRAP transporter fused permease subunit [Alphaproteobacteria bacterium]